MSAFPEPLQQREPKLPADAAAYRTIGPFDAQSLPQGLLREHRLKAGVWGLLLLETGSVRFVWDDAAGGSVDLAGPCAFVVPPEVPHHLEDPRDLRLAIEFLSTPD